MQGFFRRLRDGLSKTRDNFTVSMDNLVKGTQRVDEAFFEELLDILVLADAGVQAAEEIVADLREKAAHSRVHEAEEVRELFKQILFEKMHIKRPALRWPMVMLVVGVNGVGKTTTVGKLALRFKELGRSVMLAAADTFRAAADEQLQVWAQRAAVPMVSQRQGSDPAAVVFDAVQSCKAKGTDLLIVDTAGRIHTRKSLMDEIGKIRRVIDREFPQAEMRCMLVIDATTGQNGLLQAKAFKQAVDINGIILTKLDGTAKGGIAVAIQRELGIPVWYIGVGEGIDDLQPFDARQFVDALF